MKIQHTLMLILTSLLLVSCNSGTLENIKEKEVNTPQLAIENSENDTLKQTPISEHHCDGYYNPLPSSQPPEDLGQFEWEPDWMQRPSKGVYNRFNLPQKNMDKIKKYFYDEIDLAEKTHKNDNDSKLYWEGGSDITGSVEYKNCTEIHYSVQKEHYYGSGTSDTLEFHGNFAVSQNFSDFDNKHIYQMLEIAGAIDTKQFFQELLDSPRLKEYPYCNVQEKRTKYVSVELIACKDSDITILSVYRPN